ncbi:prepilin-type N-terminal cleavage/methylation domain-containing protein [Candidatus Saccharibacteria bacterium]|nr:prepilin-type N-terminal cleavage/methylation domain-containing protein [Candidatus Saccharibacteria bacterium]MBR0431987.1 prepilin-type N-terminal cleavage/methylation domain-containing protein [Candidatus Saccharibacteria bacterium]
MRQIKEKNKRKKGFTLIELSLSLVFIGILSLTIAYVINDTIGSYRRGLTLSQINTVGIDLVDDIRMTIQNSSANPIVDECERVYSSNISAKNNCKDDGAQKFMYIVRTGDLVKKNSQTLEEVPLYGAFCTGRYSYIWNSGYFFDLAKDNSNMATFKYEFNGEEKTLDGFRLLKIRDGARAVCVAAVGGSDGKKYSSEAISNEFDITEMNVVIGEEPVDLLKSDEKSGGLALYNLYVPMPARDIANSSALYSVSFVLGTVQGGIDITKSGGFCATPDDYEDANFDYCAINKFNFAALATGGL